MKRIVLIIISLFLIAGYCNAQTTAVYECVRTKNPVLIDGKISPEEWARAAWSDKFLDITGDPELKPSLFTHIKMLWDDEHLYIAAQLQEPNLWATLTQKDAVIYQDNDFEVFIDPDGDTHNYFEFEINQFGTYWDLLLEKPYRDLGKAKSDFDLQGIRSAVQLNGSINDPADTDSGWSIEIAIPLSSISALSEFTGKPMNSDFWRINFSRVEWKTGIIDGNYVKQKDTASEKPLPEQNWVWSPQGVVDMHRPEHWGYIVFKDDYSGNDFHFLKTDEDLCFYLRSLYYSEKQFFLKEKKYTDKITDLAAVGDLQHVNAERPEIRLYGSGYEIILKSETSERAWHIDQSGKIGFDFPHKNWIWMHSDEKNTDKDWDKIFRKIRNAGFDAVLFGDDDEQLKRIIPIAHKNKLEVHAWIWIMNCNKPEILEKHADWYNVNRNGEPSNTSPQYVAYYKWFCPSRPEVKDYIKSRVANLCAIDGLDGIHFDYIRFPDVILPEALQPKYNIVQDKEHPQYDYCYCTRCKKLFLDKCGINIDTVADPAQCKEWKEFRYGLIRQIVEAGAEIAHDHGKKLSAAVFPSPEIARTLVRQDWSKWPLDATLPMMYNNFYDKGTDWIGQCVIHGKSEIKNRFPIYTGLYLPELKPEQLKEAIRIANQNGACGISVFDYNAIKKEQYKVLKKELKGSMKK